MRRRYSLWAAAAWVMTNCSVVLAQEEKHIPTLQERFPWMQELFAGLGAFGLIVFFVYWMRPRKYGGNTADFRIFVEAGEVVFQGGFPASQEGIVEDFLLNDCPISGPYEIAGYWKEGILVIQVRGENAKLLEQRIRNFLKLTVKKAT